MLKFIADLCADLGKSFGKFLMLLLAAFVIGTAAAGIACLYYDVPLVFALGGGFIAMALPIAISMDSNLFG